MLQTDPPLKLKKSSKYEKSAVSSKNNSSHQNSEIEHKSDSNKLKTLIKDKIST